MTSNIASSIVQPAFGAASDRAQVRYLLPLGVLMALAGFAAVGIAPSYPLLLAAVAVSGFGNAVYHPEASKSAHFVAGNGRATGLYTFMPLYAMNVLHRSPAGNGWLLSLYLGSGARGTLVAPPLADRYGKEQVMVTSLAFAPFLITAYVLVGGQLGLVALVLAGACVVGTFSISLVMGQEFLPNSLALASAPMIGFTTGLGGLGVAALGHLADLQGLRTALLALAAVAAGTVGLTALLPNSERRIAASVVDIAAVAR